MQTRDDMTEDTRDALELIGLPVVQFEPPARQIVETRDGEYRAVTTTGWIKFAIAFRNVLPKLKGAKLAVFLCICLHVNENGESWPGLGTIGKETGYDRAAVINAIKQLIEIPGLLDVTHRKGTSNLYRPAFASYGTGVVAKTTMGVVSKTDTGVVAKTTTRSRTNKKNQEVPAREKPPRETPALFSLAQSIATVCGMDFNANRGRLFREAKELSTAQPAPTPELVKQHYNGNPAAFWKRDDWRGQKGQLPTPGAIRETWGKWAAKPAPKSTNGWNLKAAK